MKRITAILLTAALALSLCACGSSTDASSGGNSSGSSPSSSSSSSSAVSQTTADSADGTAAAVIEKDENAFADGDTKDVTGESADAAITLSGGTGTISDTTRGSSGSEVTITAKGIYRITGSSDGVTIVVNDETESGNIYLILDSITMTNDTAPCISVTAADKVILQCVGENSLTAGSSSADLDAVIYAKDDLTINGSGSLTLTGAQHGIVCKDDLKITGAVLTVAAEKHGLNVGDSVRIGGGTVRITAGHDGIQVENGDGDSYFYMEDGVLTVNAGYDGIQVSTSGSSMSGYITVVGGTLAVTAGGGSDNSKTSTSQKGLKSEGSLYIGGGELTVSAADDALHSEQNVYITGGTLTASSSDDGIHADGSLTISGGTVSVLKSYEGLEATTVWIADGTVSVYASDDGINAAGGSDTSSDETGPWSNSSSTGTLTISGGTLYVNAQGDGLDSNGSLYVSGGLVIVEGPTNGGNGALDKGDGNGCVASITGGTVLAIGTADMAVNFDTGTQCSALVTLSGSAGDTITVNDGSGFSFTATKSFACAVYSSPYLSQGSSYTITAGSSSATMDFASSLYYSDVSSMGPGGQGGPGGQQGPGGR